MKEHCGLIIKGEAEALTEDEWGAYISRLSEVYEYNEDDEKYGVDLFQVAYPTDWTAIPLRNMTIPEAFSGHLMAY